MTKTISPKGISFLEGYEIFRANPYYATVNEKAKGIVTIGYGSTFYPDGRKVRITDPPVTKEQARNMYIKTLAKFEADLRKLIKVEVTQNQWDALVSFIYNIGVGNFETSSVLREVNNKNFEATKANFAKWNKQKKADGTFVVIRGLTLRRAAEAKMFGGSYE